MDALFGKTITILSQVLDYRSRKHDAIVSNIANIDTPGYRAREVVFEKELARRIRDEAAKPGQGTKSAVVMEQSPVTVVETDKRVNIDEEMSRLAENTIMYNLGVELLARKLRSLRELVREVR
ncbi:MAG: flagellar basal body rod protein FlgB [Syntrophales bacterium]|nr:flagellar basal body rod protein FlgB [Syntrophales bacterium]